MNGDKWIAEEEALITAHQGTYGWAKLVAKKTGRTIRSVRLHRQVMRKRGQTPCA